MWRISGGRLQLVLLQGLDEFIGERFASGIADRALPAFQHRLAHAWIRCVLPRPVPQDEQRIVGAPGASTTASDAACANEFEGPTTKLSKVCRGFNAPPTLQVFRTFRFADTSFSTAGRVAAGTSAGGRELSTVKTIVRFSSREMPSAFRIMGR